MLGMNHKAGPYVTPMDLTTLDYIRISIGADLSDADLTNVVWYYTTCPDGTNSNDNGNTCVNNL